MTAIPEVHAASIGFEGWRFDLTQSIEPWYLWEWLSHEGMRGKFAFFEYWENASGREMQEWLDLTGRTAAIYDWNLRNILKEMCEEGDSFDMRRLAEPSLLGLEPAHTVTYLDNHDTMREDDVEKMGIRANKPLGYAYIFHSKGLPMVFWWDYFDGAYMGQNLELQWGTQIRDVLDRLIKIRKRVVGGTVSVVYADADVYAQERDGGNGKHKSLLVLNAASGTRTVDIPTTWSATSVMDLAVTNGVPNVLYIAGDGKLPLTLPPKSYQIYSTTNAWNQLEAP